MGSPSVTHLTADLPLPPTGCKSWSAHKKAAVVLAIRNGALSRHDAYDHYMLSEEELAGWEAVFEEDGLAGLQAQHVLRAKTL